MKTVYGDDCRWAARARKHGPHLNVCDKAQSGRPRTATDGTHRNRVDQLISENRRIKQAKLALQCGISREPDCITTVQKSVRTVGALNAHSDMKQRRLDISQHFLLRFEREGDGFLNNIVTGDESCVHYFDPQNKRASMEYRQHGSPA